MMTKIITRQKYISELKSTKILSNNNVVHMLYFFILIAFSIGSLMVDIQTCHYYVLDKPHNTKDQENYVEDEIST